MFPGHHFKTALVELCLKDGQPQQFLVGTFAEIANSLPYKP
jgi:hypothetical protein